MPFLATPSEKYKESYLEAAREFQAEDRHLHDNLTSMEQQFGDFVQRLLERDDRSKLPPGIVPGAAYWLIDGNEYIGLLSLRYELNEHLRRFGGHIGYEIRPSKRRLGYGKEILRLGLEKARAHGLTRVLVTCDEDNTGSKKIIEHNGGQFENTVEVKGEPVKKLRYWIDIP